MYDAERVRVELGKRGPKENVPPLYKKKERKSKAIVKLVPEKGVITLERMVWTGWRTRNDNEICEGDGFEALSSSSISNAEC